MTDKIYIKFESPILNDSQTKDNAILKILKNAIIKVISLIIPKANPDFEELLDSVKYWKVEYDIKEDATWREIGFDINGTPIVAMPLGNNYGYWIDNNLKLDDYMKMKSTEIEKSQFEHDWNTFEEKFNSQLKKVV